MSAIHNHTLVSKVKLTKQASILVGVSPEFVITIAGKRPKRALPELCRTCKPPSF